MRIKLTLDYIGSRYHGWQLQPGKDTVQKRLEDALSKLCGEEIHVVASGRTDSGVHAFGQVVHFDTTTSYDIVMTADSAVRNAESLYSFVRESVNVT